MTAGSDTKKKEVKLETELEHLVIKNRVRGFHLLDRRLLEPRATWVNYLYQSLMAMLVMFFVLLSVNLTTGGIIIAVIGSTAFIVFAMPRSVTAKPRNIIGGHLVGAG
ncbi:MAG: HPP family protein, partial [Thermoplasmata archaeon]|nr:HPP family protein [Thermoplasmata archaeon]